MNVERKRGEAETAAEGRRVGNVERKRGEAETAAEGRRVGNVERKRGEAETAAEGRRVGNLEPIEELYFTSSKANASFEGQAEGLLQ
jgi:hypothetical protein